MDMNASSQKIIVLGLTGSVGSSCLRVIEQYQDKFSLVGFSYHKNFSLAQTIQRKFLNSAVCCTNPNITNEEKNYWQQQKVHLFYDMQELLDIEFDSLLTAVVGSLGLSATFKAVSAGKKILLANKETLVMAGELIMQEAKKKSAKIIPVDSEHSSLFRLLFPQKQKRNFQKMILTASGGPLRQLTAQEISLVKKEQVLDHPTWQMGNKITVDSASMANKALELMEAHFLFDTSFERLSAVIHPQSYVHAILQEQDGSFFFHVSPPDMIYPVAYALFYPEPAPNLDTHKENSIEKLLQIPHMWFEEIDKNKFPAFFLGVQAGKAGGGFPTIFNAANEQAVALFLQNKISFAKVVVLIENTLEKFSNSSQTMDLEYLFRIDNWARAFVKENTNGI